MMEKTCKRIAEVLLDGKEPVNPIYLNQTDKVKLLVYAGDFSDTQETEAFYEFLNKVDYEHFDVTLIGNGAKEEESSEKLNSLPKKSGFYTGSVPTRLRTKNMYVIKSL